MQFERGYKFRFYPTKEQKIVFAQTFGCVRVVYNHFLHYRQESYIKEGKKVSYHDTSSMLTVLKKTEEKQWLNEVSSVPLQQSLRCLQVAYTNFFSKRSGYPSFKKKSTIQSAIYTKSAFTFEDDKLIIAKIEKPLKIKWSRKFKGDPSTVTISKDAADRFFVSFLVKEEIRPKKKLKTKVGIDLGLNDLVATSEGLKIKNPKHLKKYEVKLAKEQKKLSKKAKGSSNRTKARIKVAKVYRKIADTRKDFLHKLSTKLINENQVICVEDLAVKNMVKNRCLAKTISDVGWSELVRQLEYKSKWYGRDFVKIDRFFPTSKRCFECGHTVDSLPLDIRSWECPRCKTVLDRDINASKNILAVGTTVLACGEDVNLVSIKKSKLTSVKQESSPFRER